MRDSSIIDDLKNELYNNLVNRNVRESIAYDDIIKNYKDLLTKFKKTVDKSEMLDRENNSLKRITGDPTTMNELTQKIQVLERELTDSMKENKSTSNKLLEILTDNLRLKDTNENLNKQNITKQARLLELEQIVKEQDEQLHKFREDNQFLKGENAKLEKQNISLNENLNKKIIENNTLINEILTIKNDYMVKMNEMLELVDNAKKKKEVRSNM